MLQVGRKNEIWHKDVSKDGEAKLVRNHVKIDVKTISLGTFVFALYVYL